MYRSYISKSWNYKTIQITIAPQSSKLKRTRVLRNENVFISYVNLPSRDMPGRGQFQYGWQPQRGVLFLVRGADTPPRHEMRRSSWAVQNNGGCNQGPFILIILCWSPTGFYFIFKSTQKKGTTRRETVKAREMRKELEVGTRRACEQIHIRSAWKDERHVKKIEVIQVCERYDVILTVYTWLSSCLNEI